MHNILLDTKPLDALETYVENYFSTLQLSQNK